MHRRTPAIVLGLAAVVALGAACHGPAVPHPLVGQTRYLCCNLRYEKPEVTDNWYQVGGMIPLGTRVQIVEVRRDQVKFQPEGFPQITLTQKYGDKVLPFDQYLSRVFVERNPKLSFGKKKDRLELAVEQGRIEKGMTREQVAMAVGYPPANHTASLEAPDWHYWANRWKQYIVWFEHGRVERSQE